MIIFPYYSYKVNTAHSGAEIARGLKEGYGRARGVTTNIYGGEIDDKGFTLKSIGSDEENLIWYRIFHIYAIIGSYFCQYITITGTIRKDTPASNTNTIRIIINANIMTYLIMGFYFVMFIFITMSTVQLNDSISDSVPYLLLYSAVMLIFWLVPTYWFSKYVKDFRRYFDCVLKSLKDSNEPIEAEILKVLGK